MSIEHQDYQEITQWRGVNLLPASQMVFPAGQTNEGPWPLWTWAGVQLRVQVTAGKGKLIVKWWDSQAQTVPLGAETYNVIATTVFVVNIPSKGPWVSFQADTGVGGSLSANIQLTPVNLVTDRITYPGTNNVLDTGVTAIGAGATSVFVFSWIQAGLAIVSVTPADNAGKLGITVAQLDYTQAVVRTLFDLGSPAGIVTPQVALVDDTCGFVVANADGVAAHSVSLRIVAGAARS